MSLLKESGEYLFEIKISNFKIVLSQLVEYIEKLSVDEDDEDDKVNIISIVEELVKQYEIINDKISNFKEDIEGMNNTKIKLENKITILHNLLTEAEGDITKFKELYDREKEEHSIDNKKIKELTTRVEKMNDFSNSLESLVKEKTDEVLYYKNKLESLVKEKEKEKKEKENEKEKNSDAPPLDVYKVQQSPSYIQKMNDSNNKLLSQKSDKIKNLEKDLRNMNGQVVELQITLSKRDEYIVKLENDIVFLNKEYNEKINNLKVSSTNLETEILIEKYKEEIESLKKELKNKGEYIIPMHNNLETPLINSKKESVNKCFCNIL